MYLNFCWEITDSDAKVMIMLQNQIKPTVFYLLKKKMSKLRFSTISEKPKVLTHEISSDQGYKIAYNTGKRHMSHAKSVLELTDIWLSCKYHSKDAWICNLDYNFKIYPITSN